MNESWMGVARRWGPSELVVVVVWGEGRTTVSYRQNVNRVQ